MGSYREAWQGCRERVERLVKRIRELEPDSERLDFIDKHLLIIHPPTPSDDELDALWVVCAYELPNRVDRLSEGWTLRQAIDKAREKI